MTPSSPAPSKRCSQSTASFGSRVIGVRCSGRRIFLKSCSSWRRRSSCGTANRLFRPIANRSNATKAAGAAFASFSTREAARQSLEEHSVQLREVAVQGLQVPALDVDVVRASEDDRAKPVPLGLKQKVAAFGDVLRDLGE